MSHFKPLKTTINQIASNKTIIIEGERKVNCGKNRIKEFITTKQPTQKILEGILWIEEKDKHDRPQVYRKETTLKQIRNSNKRN